MLWLCDSLFLTTTSERRGVILHTKLHLAIATLCPCMQPPLLRGAPDNTRCEPALALRRTLPVDGRHPISRLAQPCSRLPTMYMSSPQHPIIYTCTSMWNVLINEPVHFC